MSWFRQLAILIALGVLGVVAWAGFSQLEATSVSTDGRVAGPGAGPGAGAGAGPGGGPPGAARPGTRTVLVDARPVTSFTIADSVLAVGTAQATRAVTIYPRANGEVADLLIRPGAQVAEGDVLLLLDDAEQQIAVQRQTATLEDAERTAARFEQLGNTSAVSRAQVDQARAALATARADLAAAELALERRIVRAPFDGVLGIALVERGEHISTTTPIVTLDDRSTLLINFVVPERYAGSVRIGMPVSATTRAFPGRTFEGEVVAIDSRVDSAVRTLAIRASVANPDDILRPGLTFAVTLEFEGQERSGVPELAVQWDRQGSFVWRVEDGVVRRTPVTVLERTGGRVALAGPLQEGDLVVVAGTQRLSNGWPVQVADESAQGGPL